MIKPIIKVKTKLVINRIINILNKSMLMFFITFFMFMIAIYSLNMNKRLFTSMYRPFLNADVIQFWTKIEHVNNQTILKSITLKIEIKNFGLIPSKDIKMSLKFYQDDIFIREIPFVSIGGILFPNDSFEKIFEANELSILCSSFNIELLVIYEGINQQTYQTRKKLISNGTNLIDLYIIDGYFN